MRKAAAPLLLLLLSAACSGGLRAGVVDEKVFVPAHTEQRFVMNLCIMYADGGHCSVSIPIYEDEVIPDKWYLRISEGQQGATVEVFREFYDLVQEGDHVDCARVTTCVIEQPPGGM